MDGYAATPAPQVVLLRGAPGVGKSAVAAVLEARGLVRTIVEVDTVRRMIVGVDWSDRLQHDAALAAGARAAAQLAVTGLSPVLLIDCFGRDLAQRAVGILEEGGAVATAVTLWAQPDALRARLSQRVDDYENSELALLINAEMGAGAGSFIDTTARTPDEVADQVWDHIEGAS